MRLGKGDGRFKVGGSFGVGVEQLRNGGCLSLPVKLPDGQGQQARAKLAGQASSAGAEINPTPMHPPLPPPFSAKPSR